MFPHAIQQEVFYAEHRQRLLQVPMFRTPECDELFLAAIASTLRVTVVLDNDHVFRAGEFVSSPAAIQPTPRTSPQPSRTPSNPPHNSLPQGDRMYFIKMGYVRITAAAAKVMAGHSPSKRAARRSGERYGDGKKGGQGGGSVRDEHGDVVLANLGSGDYFGEMALFAGLTAAVEGEGNDASPGTQRRNAVSQRVFTEQMRRRSGSAIALSDCILIILYKVWEAFAKPPPLHSLRFTHTPYIPSTNLSSPLPSHRIHRATLRRSSSACTSTPPVSLRRLPCSLSGGGHLLSRRRCSPLGPERPRRRDRACRQRRRAGGRRVRGKQ